MDTALTHQVATLGDLLDGWFDETIEPYSVAALHWLADLLENLIMGFKLPVPYVYPTAHGRVRASWATPRCDVMADIDLSTHDVNLVACVASTREVHAERLQLEAPGAESQLGWFVAGHTT